LVVERLDFDVNPVSEGESAFDVELTIAMRMSPSTIPAGAGIVMADAAAP